MSIQPSTLPAPCYRCTDNRISFTPGIPTNGLCLPCIGEVAANRDQARDELIRTVYTGHGIGHTYRTDVAL